MRERLKECDLFSPNAKQNKHSLIIEDQNYTFCQTGYGDINDTITGCDILLSKNNVEPQDRPEACARQINSKFYIKINSYTGEIFNPRDKSMLSTSNKKTLGEKIWLFKEVPQNAFQSYLSFLKSNNKLDLNLTRRNLKNG